MASPVYKLAQQLGELLQLHKLKLTTAESCTGGQLAQAITMIPGSSSWFERGFITYSNLSKQQMLGVHTDTLNNYGAVSEQTAREMAQGALTHSSADISIAVTGIAGPEGEGPDKPPGTVWFAWTCEGFGTLTHLQIFSGDRLFIRDQAVEYALQALIKFTNSNKPKPKLEIPV
ncbi:7705_t:CDS:1 [Ambispora gerdemannii]|uniref:7705_t:CDS:1 n=1 Tax=Ambispora gerdemannii TaxID=144530 RepID=A0A9N8V288_9GLOM|nr:7705_t:CDS:1 [Ambispora gerdemannii]